MNEPMFGNLTPAEAGRRGGEAKAGKKAEQAREMTPGPQIEAAMQKKAIGGDVNAAREYCEWLKLNRATGVNSLNADILRLLTEEQLDTLEAGSKRGRAAAPLNEALLPRMSTSGGPPPHPQTAPEFQKSLSGAPPGEQHRRPGALRQSFVPGTQRRRCVVPLLSLIHSSQAPRY
jgi:hypothetical protein